MRSTGLVAIWILAAGLTAARPTPVEKPRDAGAPSVPDTTEPPSAAGAGDAYARKDTIRVHRNRAGQVVYAVSASHFDVSPPFREMAVRAAAEPEIETEASRNPQLPAWRRILSSVPDPVVQRGIASAGEPGTFSARAAAPTTGFNFQGVGISGSTPSDSNGSVGNNQFVETVNSRYQVWSLNRASRTATTVLGPIAINTLWSGFGGACQNQNSGDPIVLYDKPAERWLISQLTSSSVAGLYFQCVALSTGADATGSFYRWAFAVPNGLFGDYPHFGAWTDAYYMMAHGFTSATGGYVAGLFAALDRSAMLVGSPSATWQVIEDPLEGGHMPADLDGVAPPPTGAPGIFVSLHNEGMAIYRMDVDFQTPANTVLSEPAIVPVAPSTGACGGGGACIPQPGTSQTVSSLGDRLMFRAAYRNFVDHESLVVSHSVDPSVPGVVSGVRWYDFRLSGTPDAACATYPCAYQQGTLADAAGGRSRWMPSLAMDAAENVLVGYSTTGTVAGLDDHSIRYTGRAKTDPPGTLTAPEQIIVTGTANNTNSRWGDYASMSVDPFDDCTFWYVNQYFTSLGNWSTRIASARFPSGTGAGECPTTSCPVRPASAPAIGSASVPGENQITVTWTGIVPQAGSYAIERADGACGGEGPYRPLAWVPGTATSFTDTHVLGGLTYSYRVVAAADAQGRCQAAQGSACVQATATGACDLAPSFAGATTAASADQSTCGVTVSWAPATSSCPLTPNMSYNVFRGTAPDFVPSPANRIATCVPGPASYLDTDDLQSGVTYHYVVRAEDDSIGNGGECGGGNEDANVATVAGTPYGSGLQAAPSTWIDLGGDGVAHLRQNVPGPGNTADAAWRFVKTADDAGANHTSGGQFAYRNAGPGPAVTYGSNVCAEMDTPELTVGSTAVRLEFWERHQLEYHWDGVAVEYSVNGGTWLDVPAPSNDTGAGCAASDSTTGWERLSCTLNPPVNACGYPSTKLAYTGPLASGTSCSTWTTSGTVTAYAHRCHPISGLVPGDTIRFRWRFTSDPGAEYTGLYLDDIRVSGILLPEACTADACAGGPPSEVLGLGVFASTSTTVSWAAAPDAGVVYDVVSSTLSVLRANGAVTAATCVADDVPGTNFVDPRPDPSPGDGYYYLVRAQSPCGAGTYGVDASSSERVPSSGCP